MSKTFSFNVKNTLKARKLINNKKRGQRLKHQQEERKKDYLTRFLAIENMAKLKCKGLAY